MLIRCLLVNPWKILHTEKAKANLYSRNSKWNSISLFLPVSFYLNSVLWKARINEITGKQTSKLLRVWLHNFVGRIHNILCSFICGNHMRQYADEKQNAAINKILHEFSVF